jgi:hypothetical protein
LTGELNKFGGQPTVKLGAKGVNGVDADDAANCS